MERMGGRNAPLIRCWLCDKRGSQLTMKKRAIATVVLAVATLVAASVQSDMSWAGDAAAGKTVFDTKCHTCHAALPYTGRVGVANLPSFLANPRRFNPKTAMTFPGLRSRKEIDDVIAYITEGR
jgi:cytochrome c2